MANQTAGISRGATGGWNRPLLGGVVLLLGSGIMCGTTLGGLALYQNVLVLGLIVVAAWLLDGTNRRYMGVGLGATAVGLGLVLGNDFGLPATEHGIVYPLIGLALIAITRINPREAQGLGGFLVIVGLVVWSFRAGWSYDGGWTLTAILAVWGILRIAQSLRGASSQPSSAEERDARQAELSRS